MEGRSHGFVGREWGTVRCVSFLEAQSSVIVDEVDFWIAL